MAVNSPAPSYTDGIRYAALRRDRGQPTAADSGGPSDLVKQFDQMRQGLGGGAPAFAAPEPVSFNSGSPQGQAGGSVSGAGFSGQLNLVDWGGRQVDRSLVPYAEKLQSFGLRFSGGYRDPARNAAVNGVPGSHHLTGMAMDWSGTQAQMQQGAAWARANGAREVLIHNAGSGLHLHVAW